MTAYTFPFPPAKLTPHAKGHWRPKAEVTREFRNRCGWLAKKQGLKPMNASTIEATITIHRPDRRRDYQNCIAAFKAGIDGIADVIGIDDRYWKQTWVEGELDRPDGSVVVEFHFPEANAEAQAA